MNRTPVAPLPSIDDHDALSMARSHERLRDRWRLRALIGRMGDHRSARDGSWDAVPFARTAGCGRMLCSADGAEIRRRDGRHYVAGVSTCGSVWLCPVCEAKIRTRRAVEMRELGAAHVAAGGSLGLLTLTVRHGPQNGLEELVSAELEAWKSIQQDDRWRSLQRTAVVGRRGGVRWIEAGDELLVGHARTTEATQGFTVDPLTGSWHPHQHVVLFWRDGEDHSADVGWIENAWAERVEARLGLRPGTVGFDYRTIDASNVDYISKIADEITRADLKGGSRSIWALVEHAAEGDALAVRRWLEWCSVMKGRRCIHLSHGLRARYGLDPEKSDEDLAVENVDGEHVEHVEARKLSSLMRCGWGEYPRMVDYLIGLDRAFAEHAKSQVVVESCREPWHAVEHAPLQEPLFS